MTKKREHDPELESLLRAFRNAHPSADERDGWRAAVAAELEPVRTSGTDLGRAPPARSRVYRIVRRTLIQAAIAASLGFVIGAYYVERRYDAGQAMLFSQTEPSSPGKRPPLTMDEEREVIHINLDSGDSR